MNKREFNRLLLWPHIVHKAQPDKATADKSAIRLADSPMQPLHHVGVQDHIVIE